MFITTGKIKSPVLKSITTVAINNILRSNYIIQQPRMQRLDAFHQVPNNMPIRATKVLLTANQQRSQPTSRRRCTIPTWVSATGHLRVKKTQTEILAMKVCCCFFYSILDKVIIK